jgi:hypothetical protein
MELKTDQPFGLQKNFIGMGIVTDSDKDYICILQLDTGQMYIEEIHWGRGENIHLATLHQIEDDEEWKMLWRFISEKTTIFSPIKINMLRENPGVYVYNKVYTGSPSFKERLKRGTL